MVTTVPCCLQMVYILVSRTIKVLVLYVSHHGNISVQKLPPCKRLGQIHHARLRTSCSSLRQHLFEKNIIDSPDSVNVFVGQ